MTNIKIEKTGRGYVVKADTERFGKAEIMYEAPSEADCIKYIVRTLSAAYRLSDGHMYHYLKELMNWIPAKKLSVLHNACYRNYLTTSFYGLEWGDTFTDPDDGLYFKMYGNRGSRWSVYVNNAGEFTRCPSTKRLIHIDHVPHEFAFDFMG